MTRRDLERRLDELEGSDGGEPTHQDLADAWRAALESNPRTYDELMAIYKSELRDD